MREGSKDEPALTGGFGSAKVVSLVHCLILEELYYSNNFSV